MHSDDQKKQKGSKQISFQQKDSRPLWGALKKLFGYNYVYLYILY